MNNNVISDEFIDSLRKRVNEFCEEINRSFCVIGSLMFKYQKYIALRERESAKEVIRKLREMQKDSFFMQHKATLHLNDPIIEALWKNK